MKGGRAEKKGITREMVDPNQLRIGMRVEMEHTNDPCIAEQIALDHLAEFGNYYYALAEMERALAKAELLKKVR